MNIPPKYEDVVAQLEISQRHLDRMIEAHDALQQRLTAAEQRDADNLKLICGLVEYADNLLVDVNNAWSYAGSTGAPEIHKDEDYAAALTLIAAIKPDEEGEGS